MPAKFVPLTRDLALAFYGQTPEFSLRGYAIMLDEALVGLMGVYFESPGTLVAFSEFVEEDILSKRDRICAGKKILALISERRLPVVAYCKSFRDRYFLEKLGFRFTVETAQAGFLLTWSPS